MELTIKQQEAVKIAVERYRSGERFTVISGYAGSGKTTCVSYIIDALGLDPETEVVFCAFTGKATRVLSEMGNKNTKTLHKLLYQHFPDGKGGFGRKRKEKIDYKLVVVDEIGMVEKDLTLEMFSHPECHYICLGDPAQLPPVSPDSDNNLLKHPHCFLDEIMRQAQESEIIRLTMDIRAGKPLQPYKGKDIQVVHRNELVDGMLTWADQVICATNKTRTVINNFMRELNGYDKDVVMDGEKIIFTRNYWDFLSRDEDPIVNGTIGTLSNPVYREKKIVPKAGGGTIPIYESTVVLENGDKFYNVPLDASQILYGVPSITDWKQIATINKVYKQKWYIKNGFTNPLPIDGTSGYAISCHKSQGSTFNNVLVMEEHFPFSKEEHIRWLYTAATRPSNKLVLIMKD